MKPKNIVIGILCMALVLALMKTQGYPNLKVEYTDAMEGINLLEIQYANATETISLLESEINTMESRVEAMQSSLDEMTAENKWLKAQHGQLELIEFVDTFATISVVYQNTPWGDLTFDHLSSTGKVVDSRRYDPGSETLVSVIVGLQTGEVIILVGTAELIYLIEDIPTGVPIYGVVGNNWIVELSK